MVVICFEIERPTGKLGFRGKVSGGSCFHILYICTIFVVKHSPSFVKYPINYPVKHFLTVVFVATEGLWTIILPYFILCAAGVVFVQYLPIHNQAQRICLNLWTILFVIASLVLD